MIYGAWGYVGRDGEGSEVEERVPSIVGRHVSCAPLDVI